MACDCINEMNALASEKLGVKTMPMCSFNLRTGNYMFPPLECVEDKLRGRKKKINIYGNYCPFCGVRYEPKEKDA